MGKLLKRQPNEAMLAAYRANGAKAHGAVTDRGKSVVRFNAAQHWGRAEMMRQLLPALGEHAEDFGVFSRSISSPTGLPFPGALPPDHSLAAFQACAASRVPQERSTFLNSPAPWIFRFVADSLPGAFYALIRLPLFSRKAADGKSGGPAIHSKPT